MASYSANTVRRSWLLIPAIRDDLIERDWRLGADVIVLDLEDLVHDSRKAQARERVKAAIGQVRRGGAEVFVRCDLQLLRADLRAAVWPGLTGIMLPKVTAIEQVQAAEAELSSLQRERGVSRAAPAGEVNEADEPRHAGSGLELHLAFENAAGNHAAESLLRASSRVTSASLGRADLVMGLRPEPLGELHLLPHLMQRLITVAGACGVAPIGAWWQANSRGLRASAQDTLVSARLGRAAGFKGGICLEAEQVEALNQGFTPTADEVGAARRRMQAFAEAAARGEPHAGVDGYLIDRALADAARAVIDQAAACAARDRAKAEVMERERVTR